MVVPRITSVRSALRLARTASGLPVPDTAMEQYPVFGIPRGNSIFSETDLPGRTPNSGVGFVVEFLDVSKQVVGLAQEIALPLTSLTAKDIPRVLSLTLTATQLKASALKRVV
jgi:hypothetical protein